jgi:hypothetical protein
VTKFGARRPAESTGRNLATDYATCGKTKRRRRGVPNLAGKKKKKKNKKGSEREVEIDRGVYVVKSAAPRPTSASPATASTATSGPRTGVPPKARTACATATERLS